MDKNAVPPKKKTLPFDSSEEETTSSDEETEDEEQAEGGSGFGSGSDESTDTTKLKLINVLPSRQPSAVKAAAPASAPAGPAKRTRESSGKKDKEDKPLQKRKKSEVTTRRAAPKPKAQQSEKKSATKTKRGKPTPPVKEKPSIAEKKSATKRKATIPALKTSVPSRSEDETPQKPKSSSRPWSPDEELALSRELQRDRVNNVYGSSLPSSRSDPYWEKLVNRFSFMDKYEMKQRIERLFEKVRRMRLRYESLHARLRAGETRAYKNSHEQVLWQIWDTIWGFDKVTPKMLNGDDSEEDDEEEEDGSDEGTEEDDEEVIVPTQVKEREAPATKKVISKEVVVVETSSDEEDSPVKATPAPAPAPALPALLASAATPGAGKQAPVSESVPAKGPAVSAMNVDLGRNISRVAVHDGAQDGHALIPGMIEESVRANASSKLSDEIRALLHDMRGTCMEMVEEVKAQSLLQSEKILEEMRVKIMEEFRIVVGTLGSTTAQSGRTNGSHSGRWCDMFDNPFQGMGLLGNWELPLGNPNNVKWREQSEAAQDLILQRLQLVQEQARIQQEGIRLQLNIQASAQGKHA